MTESKGETGPNRIAAAFEAACRRELDALKPGNVHRRADGHGMTPADFEASARAASPAIGERNLGVGERVLRAIERTRAAVGCNTNLGIVLLCAPLAQAALARPTRSGATGLRESLSRILAQLDRSDAELVYRAIRLAEPAGLGEAPEQDVRAPPTVGLRQAMALAAERDRIARQYVTDHADIFEVGLPAWAESLERWHDESWSAASLYLDFLARFPDTHIVRKFGAETAEAVRAQAAPLAAGLGRSADPASLEAELLDFDRALKEKGINPGTSADLTVATLFASILQG